MPRRAILTPDRATGCIFFISGGPPTRMSDYTSYAFPKIDSDLVFLIDCFREVLEEMGQTELAAALPWDEVPPPEVLPARLGQAYSVAFQLLNLVEENVSEQTRRRRESGEGTAAERGLWGEALK